jgi:hypothetical protein
MKKLIKSQHQQSNGTDNGKDSNNNVGTATHQTLNDDGWLDDMDRLSIIYSSEQPVIKLAELTDEQRASVQLQNEYGQVDGMRIRVLPVLGPIPAIMGQSLASIAMCNIADRPLTNPQTGERVGRNVRNRLYQKLIDRELKITDKQLDPVIDEEDHTDHVDGNDDNDTDDDSGGNKLYTGRVEIDSDDVEYLYGVWRNRCAVTGARIGTTLFLARWNLCKPATTDNLILISQPALERLDNVGKVKSVPTHVRHRINQRLASCRDMNSEI